MISPADLRPTEEISAYFHVPFCRKRCSYCDFHSRAGCSRQEMREEVIRSLGQFSFFHHALGSPRVHTVYIGGGTPSALDRESLRLLLKGIASLTGDTPEEWTVEANPESADRDFLSLLEDQGVTRLSLGVQSFQPRLRALLGRLDPEEGLESRLESLRGAWRGDLNLDLICGIPGQDTSGVLDDLKRLAAFEPGHVSLYSLTVEEGTDLEKALHRGEIRMPSEELSEDIWFSAAAFVTSLGFEHYEVSNFALPGKRSLHNMAYWNMKPYTGCGTSGVSTLPSVKGPVRLTAEPEGSFLREDLSARDFMLDCLLMGLRTADGLAVSELKGVFGPAVLDPLKGLIKDWKSRGFMAKEEARLRMTEKGLMLLDGFLLEAAALPENPHLKEILWPPAPISA